VSFVAVAVVFAFSGPFVLVPGVVGLLAQRIRRPVAAGPSRPCRAAHET
jgi:hypothetical protein